MDYTNKEVLQIDQLTITNHLPDIGIGKIREEIITGLTSGNKYISSKFFYDEVGSGLFEEITKLGEYYPTRTEKSILRSIASRVMVNTQYVDIVELGSGDCSKISIFFDAVNPHNMEGLHYLPVDVSQSALQHSANSLIERFPGLQVSCQVADFMCQVGKIPYNAQRLFCFFGSTIGNFEIDEAKQFLIGLSQSMQPGDQLLIGFDMVKDEKVLHAAYNDAEGVTAKFNKNILNVVNKLIGSDFNLDSFYHLAFYSKKKARIEMHLVANEEVKVNSPHFQGGSITIKKGEGIHTENSHKYTLFDIHHFAQLSGLELKEIYTDANGWFSLAHMVKPA